MNRCSLIHTMTRRLGAAARQQRGQALVEFAVILPVLMLIVYGILYFGRYMDYSNQETQLAELGARLAAVNSDPSTTLTLQNYIQQQSQPELQAGSTDVTAAKVYIYYPTGSSNAVGNSVRVCVQATFRYPFLSGLSQSVTQMATMRIEQADTTSYTVDTTLPSACSKT
jgi:Flp pilus assembly protein TadG